MKMQTTIFKNEQNRKQHTMNMKKQKDAEVKKVKHHNEANK